MRTIGIIAGNGQYPLVLAAEAKARGVRVVVAAFEGITEKKIESIADACHWLKLGELERLIEYFKKESVRDLVMAGQVTQKSILKPAAHVSVDSALAGLLKRLPSYNANTVLRAFIAYLTVRGFRFRSADIFLKNFLARRGPLTKKVPTNEQRRDIVLGFAAAKRLANSDIGQTVVVKNKVVLAVEALEGTDETIKRAALLAGEGIVVVKVARTRQDLRFDIPIVGERTLQVLEETRAACLAVEAGRVLILDKESILRKADAIGLALYGV